MLRLETVVGVTLFTNSKPAIFLHTVDKLFTINQHKRVLLCNSINHHYNKNNNNNNQNKSGKIKLTVFGEL